MKMFKKNNSGFTLIELIIAMAVIITIAVILSVVIIIHTFIFTRRVKTSIVDGEGIYSENDDIGDNESYS